MKFPQPIAYIKASSDMFGRPCLVICPRNAGGARAVYTENQMRKAIDDALKEAELTSKERQVDEPRTASRTAS